MGKREEEKRRSVVVYEVDEDGAERRRGGIVIRVRVEAENRGHVRPFTSFSSFSFTSTPHTVVAVGVVLTVGPW